MEQNSLQQPLSKLNIFSLKGVQMKTFHITWLTFFFCFFAWFGIAPLMPLVSEQLHLTKAQKGNVAIAAVSATIIARLLIGRLTDKFGPRKVYTWLLVICAFPVIFIGLADSYMTFLLFRLGIGVIGASFVLTQFHTSVMFAPNIKGTANATAGGFGNTGGGATQILNAAYRCWISRSGMGKPGRQLEIRDDLSGSHVISNGMALLEVY
jgi:NNP family nitrate/nitrite transporter-like MFS transporter